jgi:hypothetical protein
MVIPTNYHLICIISQLIKCHITDVKIIQKSINEYYIKNYDIKLNLYENNNFIIVYLDKINNINIKIVFNYIFNIDMYKQEYYKFYTNSNKTIYRSDYLQINNIYYENKKILNNIIKLKKMNNYMIYYNKTYNTKLYKLPTEGADYTMNNYIIKLTIIKYNFKQYLYYKYNKNIRINHKIFDSIYFNTNIFSIYFNFGISYNIIYSKYNLNIIYVLNI